MARKPWPRGWLTLLLAGLSTAGCRGDSPTLVDPERLVSIDQGAYGLTTQQDDVGDSPVLPLAGFRVLVYDHVPAAIAAGETPETPLAEALSNEQGFYEIRLAAARHVFCSAFLRCVWLDVPAGQRIRLDYGFDAGPGWSRGEPVR